MIMFSTGVVGLAYLHVEQLLVPPVPWARRERVSH
jgi:hypothetical protein